VCTVYCYWLPSDRAWFSARHLGCGSGYAWNPPKHKFPSPTISFKWQGNKNRHTQTSWQHDSIQDRFYFLNGCIVYVTVLYFDSCMLDISMLLIPDYTCVVIFCMFLPFFFYHSLRSLLMTLSLFAQVLTQGLHRSKRTSSTLLISSRRIFFIFIMWETLWFFPLFYYVVISETFGDIKYLVSSTWNNW